MSLKSRELILGSIRSGLHKNTVNNGSETTAPDLESVDERLSEVLKRNNISSIDSLIEQIVKELTNVNSEIRTAKSDDQIIEYLIEIISRKGIKSFVAWDTEYLNKLNLENHLEGQGLTHIKSSDKNEVAGAEIGITEVDYAIADTGTLVLLTDGNKQRSASLLPPVHVAIVRKSNIVSNINQLFDILKQRLDSGESVPSCMTFITGPSRTADIELNLTLGVHGPKELHVIIV